MNSYIFSLPDKSVVINWTYYGVPGEGSDLDYAYHIYQNDIDYEKRTYQIWVDYYQQRSQEALMQNDAFGLMDAKTVWPNIPIATIRIWQTQKPNMTTK